MAAPLAAVVLGIAGCSGSTATGDPATAGEVENCGVEVSLENPPERVVLVGSDTVPLLDAVDAVDTVVAHTDDVSEVVAADVRDTIESTELLASTETSTGGSEISTEVLLATEPDLVIGSDVLYDRNALESAGIATYVPPAYCSDESLVAGEASFELVYDQLADFGVLFGAEDAAAEATVELKESVDSAGGAHGETTAVALFLTADGSQRYAYGKASMVTPVFEAAGLTNLYADEPQRVFEVSNEDLIDKNPDVVVLLYSDEDPAAKIAAFTDSPDVAGLDAVTSANVFALPFAYADPPTPLSVAGIEAVHEFLHA